MGRILRDDEGNVALLDYDSSLDLNTFPQEARDHWRRKIAEQKVRIEDLFEIPVRH